MEELCTRDSRNKVAGGNATVEIKTDKHHLSHGIYMADLKVNGKLAATVKLVHGQ